MAELVSTPQIPTSPPAIVEKVASLPKAPSEVVTFEGDWSNLRGPSNASTKELVANQLREDTLLSALKQEISNFTGGEPRDRSAASQNARSLIAGLLNDPGQDDLFLKGVKQISEALKSKDEMTVYYATVTLSNIQGDLHFAGRGKNPMFPKPGLTDLTGRVADTIAQDALDAFNAATRQPTIGDLLGVVRGIGPRASEAEPKMRQHLDHFYSRFTMRGTSETFLCRDLISALSTIGNPDSLPLLTKVARKDSNAEVRELASKAAESIAKATEHQPFIAQK